MARRRVSDYAIFHNVDQTFTVNVYYQSGGADSVRNLPKAEAHYILSLLRNEKPVDYDADRRRFFSGSVEPVGEAEGGPLEPLFRLDRWISDRPFIREALQWEDPDGGLRTYPAWTPEEKEHLEHDYWRILSNRSPDLPATPLLAVVSGPTETAGTTLSREVAWNYYVAHVAQSLVIEADRRVAWSVQSYSAEERELLFSSRSMFYLAPRGYEIKFEHGVATPGDPFRTYEFLLRESLLRTNRLATVGAVLDWCRANLVHFTGGWDSDNIFDQWQYRGFPPVERIIAGPPRTSNPGEGERHRTGGCWGTTGFLRAVLRTVNIPAKLEIRAGHALPHFLPENRYLSHGDDPYNAMFRTMPWVPGTELMIDQTKFNEWFGSGLPHLAGVGRQVRELSLEHLPYYLLRKHCEDQSAGLSHADSRVFEIFERNYTVAQLETIDLWGRIATKISDLGGCASVPTG